MDHEYQKPREDISQDFEENLKKKLRHMRFLRDSCDLLVGSMVEFFRFALTSLDSVEKSNNNELEKIDGTD